MADHRLAYRLPVRRAGKFRDNPAARHNPNTIG
jgi:hypothetical protein